MFFGLEEMGMKKVDPRLYIKANSMYDCMQKLFRMAKLSMSGGFTNGGGKCGCFVLKNK